MKKGFYMHVNIPSLATLPPLREGVSGAPCLLPDSAIFQQQTADYIYVPTDNHKFKNKEMTYGELC